MKEEKTDCGYAPVSGLENFCRLLRGEKPEYTPSNGIANLERAYNCYEGDIRGALSRMDDKAGAE